MLSNLTLCVLLAIHGPAILTLQSHSTLSDRRTMQSQRFQWTSQSSGVTSRLRAISAVNAQVVWASGSGSTVLRTTDGGNTWRKLTVTADNLDFRDIEAVNESTAYVMSAGTGPMSRLYKTLDAGVTWTLQFQNDDPRGFFDAMAFWNAKHGIVAGDSVDLKFYLLTTVDGGKHWARVPAPRLPPALENEGAFAASGTNISVNGSSNAWFVTGAAISTRVLYTTDRGISWHITDSPLPSGKSAGIFSITFRDSKHGVMVGGDYTKEDAAIDNVAVSSDGGATWRLTRGLSGFRSVVAYIPAAKQHTLIAVGPNGADVSDDNGQSWKRLEGEGFDTISFARGANVGWASGDKGRISKLTVAATSRK